MKKLFKKLSIVLLVVFSFTLVACGEANSTDKTKGSEEKAESKILENGQCEVTIKNFNSEGKEIEETFKQNPKRIISTNQTTTEILLELGLGEYMVGTSYLDNPILPSLEKEYNKIPVLSKKYPSKEVVLEKNPDFIIGWKSAFADKNLGDVSSWQEKGVNTFIQRNSGVCKKNDLENIYKDIEDIGKIFGIEDKADNYIKGMKEKIKNIEEKIDKLHKKEKVLVIEGEGENKYRAYGDDSLAADMVEKAGGKNICEKSGSIGPENIIEMNPDVIVLIYFEQQAKDNKDGDSLLNNESLQKVNAVKNKRILYTPLSETYGGGVRTVGGIETMAKGFYPDLFK